MKKICKYLDKVKCKCSKKPRLLGVFRRSCPYRFDPDQRCSLFEDTLEENPPDTKS